MLYSMERGRTHCAYKKSKKSGIPTSHSELLTSEPQHRMVHDVKRGYTWQSKRNANTSIASAWRRRVVFAAGTARNTPSTRKIINASGVPPPACRLQIS